MRSVRALILLAAVPLLAGCATTQGRNERAKLAATRLLTARKPVKLAGANPAVAVGKVVLVHHDGAVAVVVELRNTSAAPLTDLPIVVGLRRGRHERPLNAGGGRSYFQSHVAAIGPNGATTWVFTAKDVKHLSGKPYAIVGRPVSPPISSATSLPAISTRAVTPAGPLVKVRVANDTDVPQYELPVYAVARRGARYTAAGRATVAHLGTDSRKELRVKLIGSTSGAQLTVQSQPAMFE